MQRSRLAAILAVMLTGGWAEADAQTNFQPIGLNDSVQPSERIGPDDLLAISVFAFPEMSRKVRVASDGNIELPLLSTPVHAAGLMPDALAALIAAALRKEEILVSPSVSVAVLQYSSRPVSVAGDVKHPVTFEASGSMTILTALTRAEGLTAQAGSFLTVTTNDASGTQTKTIRIKDLMDGKHPELNLPLKGGEDILVARAPKVFVVGNVRKPGSYFVDDTSDLSVLKVLALAEGVLPYTAREAYITREGTDGTRTEIPIDLRAMMDRKSSDVRLQANDLLYVRDSKGRKATMNTLDRLAGFGSATASGLVVFH